MGWIRQFRDKITVIKLGGSVMHGPFDTPYGRITVAADPYGAMFSIIKLTPGAM